MTTRLSITQHLRNEHKILRGLISQLEAAESRAQQMVSGVATELFAQLEIHMRIEEELFFPYLRESLDSDTLQNEELIALLESLRSDHVAIREAQNQLSQKGLQDRDAQDDLMKSIQVHLEREEHELFSWAENILSGRLEDIGGQAERWRNELMRSPEFKEGLPERVQNPSGGEQKRRIA